MDQTKQHDWIATLMFQPGMSIEDFNSAGITPENTGLKDKDYYEGLSIVQEQFRDNNGNFNESAFNSFYDSALLLYNDYANKQALLKVSDNYKYDPFDWRYNDKEKIDPSSKMMLNKNPMRYATNIKAMNVVTPSDWSIREVAQTNRVFDYDKNQWLDWTPNDEGGLIKGLQRPTLVVATWDSDGFHEEDGRQVEHKKGEYKYDPITGKPYYETLGNREIYDKDVLHYTDTFTKEGTKINKYDFFDSDGLDKSVGGTVMKLTAAVAPTLLGLLSPPIGLVYGGLSAAVALSQLIPTLGKAINGFFTNDNLENDFGKTLNQLEGYTARFASTVSDHSREKTVTVENAAGLIKDVALQLFQQRSIQYIPRLFKNNPNIYNNANLARTLSYAYMSGTSALESYSAFKQAGANDRTAALGMFATIAAFYKLMSIDYFRDSFFKGSWFDDNNVKSPLWNVAEDFMSSLKNEGSQVAKDVAQNTVDGNKRTLKALTRRMYDAIVRTGKPWKSSTFWERSFAEGAEETMEELFQDGIKASFIGAEALGIPMNKQREDLDFGFSAQDVLKRYGMSFFGGFVGGAIFQGYNQLETRGASLIANTPEAHLAELTKLISDGRVEEIKNILNKWHDRGRFGSTSLSGTKLSVVSNIDGDTNVALAKSDSDISQNDFIYNALLAQVNYVDRVLSEEGFKKINKANLDTLKEKNPYIEESDVAGTTLQELGAHSLVLQDINRLGSEIVRIRAKIDSRKAQFAPANDTTEAKQAAENNIKNDSVIKELEDRLKEIRKERDAILNGDRNAYYVSQYTLMLNSIPLAPFLGFSDKFSFVRAKYGKEFSELSAIQMELAEEEYNDYKNGKDKTIFSAIDVYNAFSEEFSKPIEQSEKAIGEGVIDSELSTSTIGSSYFDNIKSREEAEKRIEEFEKKGDLTEEEAQEKSDLEQKVKSLTSQINSLRRSPKRALFNATTSPTALIERLQEALNKKDVLPEDISELGDNLIEAYKNWASTKTIKRTESELASFVELLQRAATSKQDRDEGMGHWLNAQRDKVDDDINTALAIITNGDYSADLFFNWDPSKGNLPIHEKFISLVDQFYANLSNPVEAIRTYDSIVALLKENGLTEEQINSLLYTDTGNGSIMPEIGNKTIYQFLKELSDARANVKKSSIPELIQSLVTRISDTEVNTILGMLESEQNRLASQKDLEDYVIANKQVGAGLKNALYLLNALRGLLRGASDGTNSKINQFKKTGKFAEISKEATDILITDIDELISRIGFLVKLDAKNNGFKLREHKDIAVNMHLKFLSKLTDALHSEPFKREFRTNEEDAVDPAKLWEEFEPLGFENINPDNYAEYEQTIIHFEAELFNRVKKLGFTTEQIVQKIMNIFGEDTEIWKQNSSRISKDDADHITDYDFAYYLLTTLTLNSNDFHVKLNSILTEKFDKAPLYGHEYAVRMAYAMMLNPNGFNFMVDKIAETYKGSDAYIKAKRRIHNILFTFGGAGTGKTTSIALLFKELTKDLGAEYVYMASAENQVARLVESAKVEKSEKRLTYSEFFGKIAPNQFKATNIKIGEDSIVTTEKPLAFEDYSYHDTNATIKIMICDEIETLNELQLDLLSHYAEANNIIVLGLGDYKQPTTDIKDSKSTVKPSSFEDLNFIKTPSLSASLRSLSIAKNDNYNVLDIVLDDIINTVWADPEKYLDNDERNKLIDSKLANGIKLNYYESGNRLVGDRIFTDENAYKEKMDKILSMAEKDKVFIVYDSTTKSKYQADKYKGISGDIDSALGGEYDYVFVDVGFDNKNKMHELQKFYMLTQRSRLYTAVLDTQNNYKSKFNIITEENVNSGALMSISKQSIDEFRQWRLKALSKLHPSQNFEDNLKPSITAAVPAKQKILVQKQTVANSEPEQPVVENGDTPQESNESVEETAGQQELTPEAIVTEDVPQLRTKMSAVISGEENVSVQNESDEISEKFEDKENSSAEYVDFVTAVVPTLPGSNMNMDAYYRDIFSKDFLTRENNRNSVYKLLVKQNSSTRFDSIYPKYVLAVQRLIYAKKGIKDITSNLRNITESYFSGMDITKLKAFIDGPKEIRIVRNGTASDIVLRMYNSPTKSDEYVDILIGKTNILKSGIYTGGFTRCSDISFERGERISLAELMRRYPALSIISDAGIFIGPQAGNYTDAKKFIKLNDGKTFIAAGELISAIGGDEVFSAAESKGKIWTYSYSDMLKLAAIQKTLSPEQVCRFLTCWSYMKFGADSREKNIRPVQEERIKNLKYFGYYSNNGINEEAILQDLAKISGNNDWLNFRSLSDEAKKELLNKGSYIGTPANMSVIIAGTLHEILQNPDRYAESNFWYNLRRDISAGRRLWIKQGDNVYYLDVDLNDNKIPVAWRIIDAAGNKLAETKYAGVIGPDMGRNLNRLLSSAGINLQNAKALIMYSEQKNGVTEWHIHNTNQVINDFLAPFMTVESKINDLFVPLTGGFYANIYSTREATHGPWKLIDVIEHPELYTTDAYKWNFSKYKIDEKSIIPEDVPITQIDLLDEWNDAKEEIISVASRLLDSRLVKQLINNFEETLDPVKLKSATELSEKIELLLSEINDQIDAWTKTASTRKLKWDPFLGQAVMEYSDTLNVAINNALNEIGLDSNTSQYLYKNPNAISVVTTSTGIAYVYTDENGEIVAIKTNTGEQFVEILKNINNFIPDSEADENTTTLVNPIVRRNRQIVFNYLNNFIKNNVDVVEANRVIDLLKDNKPLQDTINNYLENRLMNNEC